MLALLDKHEVASRSVQDTSLSKHAIGQEVKHKLELDFKQPYPVGGIVLVVPISRTEKPQDVCKGFDKLKQDTSTGKDPGTRHTSL